MSRSRRRRKTRAKKGQRRFVVFLAIGIAVGGLGAALYSIISPGRRALEKPVTTPAVTPAAAVAMIAVVLDDFGYNYKNVESVLALKARVTFSILPNLPYSKAIARRVHQKGFEAVLHLPLEPYKTEIGIRPEVNTITTAMKKQEVVERVNKDIENTPYIRGVSGHQGSKATEDPALMRAIFEELKNKNLFFLDSLVSNKSVCRKMAGQTGIGFGRRDVFLDNKEDFGYIKGQFQQLVKRARKNGSAIGIGHDRAKTVAALAVLIPEAKAQGVEFVFVSELIK